MVLSNYITKFHDFSMIIQGGGGGGGRSAARISVSVAVGFILIWPVGEPPAS